MRITLHVQELWVGMTFSDTLLAVRNTVLSWAQGFGSKSAAHVKKIMTVIPAPYWAVGSLRVRPTTSTFVFLSVFHALYREVS